MEVLTAERLWSIPRVGSPVAAGQRLVVPVTTYDLVENRGWTRLHLVDPLTGSARPLTAPRTDATRPAVDARGRRVAFLREVDGAPQCHVLGLDGGEAERVTDLPLGVRAVRWLPDGSGLVLVVPLLVGHLTPEATRDELERRRSSKVHAHVTEDAVYRYWDRWLDDGEVPHLFTLDLTSGDLVDLTPEATRWWRWPATTDPGADFDVAPDGSEVAFVADRSDPPHRELRWTLYRVPIDGGAVEELTPELTGHVHRPRYTPDGTTLVYGMQRIPDFYADRVRLVALDRATGRHRVLTETWDRSAAEWVVGDTDVVFVAEDRGRRPLWRMSLDEETPNRIADGGTFAAPVITEDETLCALGHGLLHPPEIVRIDGAGATPITDFTKSALHDLDLGRMEEITVVGADDDPVQVFLVHPPRPRSEPPPLVHLIHGGPHGSFGDGWHWRWSAPAFAAAGYLVAMVNFHGSTGFGQEFAASIHGRWGDQPLVDIEAVTDHLVDTGRVDPDRLALAGGSYGGYLTTWITATVDRYACAVAHAAVTDLPGMYASDITMGRARNYGAEIWEDVERVQRWSPHAHAAGYSTPTLVIHGGRDYRVPEGQGLELYGVLKAKGIPARLVYYPDEHHWILSPANSLHWYDQVLEWLNLYLN